MKTEITGGLLAKLVAGVATAATLAGGTAIIKATETNAVQNIRIERVERVAEEMDGLEKSLSETKTEVVLLRKELEKQK